MSSQKAGPETKMSVQVAYLGVDLRECLLLSWEVRKQDREGKGDNKGYVTKPYLGSWDSVLLGLSLGEWTKLITPEEQGSWEIYPSILIIG